MNWQHPLNKYIKDGGQLGYFKVQKIEGQDLDDFALKKQNDISVSIADGYLSFEESGKLTRYKIIYLPDDDSAKVLEAIVKQYQTSFYNTLVVYDSDSVQNDKVSKICEVFPVVRLGSLSKDVLPFIESEPDCIDIMLQKLRVVEECLGDTFDAQLMQKIQNYGISQMVLFRSTDEQIRNLMVRNRDEQKQQ